ncbi:MAG: DUF6679 family protein [Microcystaceae cyanobacterium]
MLDRKIHKIIAEERIVSIFLRDQQRWLDEARIIALELDLVTIRYECEEDEEISFWEEMVRLESIGAISYKTASVSRYNTDLLIADDCPDAEQIYPRTPDNNQD